MIGVSGSGKTFFASEIVEYLKSKDHVGDTLYAEVRNNANLRDVLAGIAFSLRNLDIKIPFNITVQSNLFIAEGAGCLPKMLWGPILAVLSLF